MFNIGKINTKLKDFENLGVLFLRRFGSYVDNPIHVLIAFDEGECKPNFEAGVFDVFLVLPLLALSLTQVSVAVFVLKRHYPSGRTRQTFRSSSCYASQLKTGILRRIMRPLETQE